MNQNDLCNTVITEEDNRTIVTADDIVAQQINVNENFLVDEDGLVTTENLVVNNKIIANEVDVTQKWKVATLVDGANYQVEISSWKEEDNDLIAICFPETQTPNADAKLQVNDDNLIPLKSIEGNQLLGSDVSNKMLFLRLFNGSFFVFTSGTNANSGNTFDILSVYPIGSIYMSVNNVDPSTLFGGTWVPWGKGRVPVGVNEVEPEFNEVEKTGGAKSVALTVAQLAPHTHIQNEHNHVQDVHNHWITSRKMTYGPGVQPTWTALGAPDSPNADWWQDIYTDARQPHIYATTPTNQNTGNGETHNNLQSYITCYMWKRTV